MNLQLGNGTDRQQRWVQDAVSDCTYDLSLINATVTVKWADTLPDSGDLGHAHEYMVTQSGPDGFTITIISWADDPNASGNKGLPNPSADVYTWYKQSFVHELGHVVHFSQITNDAERTAAASYFWTPAVSGGSRRYGKLADWSAPGWGDNMMEAIAETFKCTCYTGRLIFANRTIWRIDKGTPWDGLWVLLIPVLKPLWQSVDNSFINGTSPQINEAVPEQFGLRYLQQAFLRLGVGPGTLVPNPGPPPAGGPHGANLVVNLAMTYKSPTQGTGPVAAITYIALWDASTDQYVAAASSVQVSFQHQAATTFQPAANGQSLAIRVVQDDAGNVSGEITTDAGKASQVIVGLPSDAILLGSMSVTAISVDTFTPGIGTVEWFTFSGAGVPDYPFVDTAHGSIAPGAAAKGLIRLS